MRNAARIATAVVVVGFAVVGAASAAKNQTMGQAMAAAAAKTAKLNADINKRFPVAQQRRIFGREVAIDRRADALAKRTVPNGDNFADQRKRALVRQTSIDAQRKTLIARYRLSPDELDILENKGYESGWAAVSPAKH